MYEAGAGFLVDVQADFLDRLATRAMVPLERSSRLPVLRELTPLVEIEGERFVLLTYEVAAVRRRLLGRKVGSLSRYRDQIRRALDILLVGF